MSSKYYIFFDLFFTDLDVSKNKNDLSLLRQFKATEELQELMEKKCNLSNEMYGEFKLASYLNLQIHFKFIYLVSR